MPQPSPRPPEYPRAPEASSELHHSKKAFAAASNEPPATLSPTPSSGNSLEEPLGASAGVAPEAASASWGPQEVSTCATSRVAPEGPPSTSSVNRPLRLSPLGLLRAPKGGLARASSGGAPGESSPDFTKDSTGDREGDCQIFMFAGGAQGAPTTAALKGRGHDTGEAPAASRGPFSDPVRGPPKDIVSSAASAVAAPPAPETAAIASHSARDSP